MTSRNTLARLMNFEQKFQCGAILKGKVRRKELIAGVAVQSCSGDRCPFTQTRSLGHGRGKAVKPDGLHLSEKIPLCPQDCVTTKEQQQRPELRNDGWRRVPSV